MVEWPAAQVAPGQVQVLPAVDRAQDRQVRDSPDLQAVRDRVAAQPQVIGLADQIRSVRLDRLTVNSGEESAIFHKARTSP